MILTPNPSDSDAPAPREKREGGTTVLIVRRVRATLEKAARRWLGRGTPENDAVLPGVPALRHVRFKGGNAWSLDHVPPSGAARKNRVAVEAGDAACGIRVRHGGDGDGLASACVSSDGETDLRLGEKALAATFRPTDSAGGAWADLENFMPMGMRRNGADGAGEKRLSVVLDPGDFLLVFPDGAPRWSADPQQAQDEPYDRDVRALRKAARYVLAGHAVSPEDGVAEGGYAERIALALRMLAAGEGGKRGKNGEKDEAPTSLIADDFSLVVVRRDAAGK